MFSGVNSEPFGCPMAKGGSGGKTPRTYENGRRFRGRLFLLRRTWQMSRQANLLSQPLNFGFEFSSCCDGALNKNKYVLRSKTSLSCKENLIFLKNKTTAFLFLGNFLAATAARQGAHGRPRHRRPPKRGAGAAPLHPLKPLNNNLHFFER